MLESRNPYYVTLQELDDEINPRVARNVIGGGVRLIRSTSIVQQSSGSSCSSAVARNIATQGVGALDQHM